MPRMTSDAQRPDDPSAWRSPAWVRLLPLVLAVIVVGVQTLHPIDDPDTWWHLRSGDDVRRDFILVGPDPWSSFTSGTWIRHQWLGDALMSWVNDVAGLPGVAWLVTAWATATFVTAYVACRRHTSIFVATAVAVGGFGGMSMTITARPQSLSLIFTLVAVTGWHAVARDHRVRLWLVPLTWVWACCHGFWFIAPVLGIVVVIGLLLERAPRGAVLSTSAVTVLSLAAAALTPVGPRLLTTPFEVSSITGFIEEWQPPSLTMPAFVITAVMTSLLVMSWLTRAHVDWAELGMVLLAVYLLMSHGRTVSLAAAIVAPLLATGLQSWSPFRRERWTRTEAGTLIVSVLVGLGLSGLLAVAQPASNGFPNRLTAALRALPAGSVVCNHYDTGGWLLYVVPHVVPTIDGRTELYGPSALASYTQFTTGGPGTVDFVRDRGCHSALVKGGSSSEAALLAVGWSAEYADGWALLTSASPRRPS